MSVVAAMLLLLLVVIVWAAYACCCVSGDISRAEERRAEARGEDPFPPEAA
jgi:hypothetical protein